MPRYGIAIDTTKCIGCHSCQVSCQNQQKLQYNQAFNWILERPRTIPVPHKGIRSGPMQPLRECSVPEGMPHGSDLYYSGGGGGHLSASVRRLQVLHRSLPV